MKLIKIAIMVACLSACAEASDTNTMPIKGDTSGLLIYYSECENFPPPPGAEWCDTYADGGSCCTWSSQGINEEWCNPPGSLCWEFNGAWR